MNIHVRGSLANDQRDNVYSNCSGVRCQHMLTGQTKPPIVIQVNAYVDAFEVNRTTSTWTNHAWFPYSNQGQ